MIFGRATVARFGSCNLSYLRDGDTIVIWKLDRLGRSTRGLIELVEELGKKGIHLVSLNVVGRLRQQPGQLRPYLSSKF